MTISAPLQLTALIGLNAVPLYFVFAHGWHGFDLIFLYWLENLIIGGFTVLRMLVRPYHHAVEGTYPLVMAPFFTFHYGMFCYVHGQFIISLFGAEATSMLAFSEIPEVIPPLIESRHLMIPVFALLLIQALFWLRDVAERGLGNESVKDLMTAPYRRIIVLHITIIASGFALQAMDQSVIGLVLLVVIKTVSDIVNWRRDRRQDRPEQPLVLDETMKAKLDAMLDDPKITINGNEVRYRNIDEMRASSHFGLLRAVMRMMGKGHQLALAEAYIDDRLRQRAADQDVTED